MNPLRDGVRFTCQGSGRCCTARGDYGYVFLSLDDRRRLATHLRLSTRRFTRRFCEKTEGEIHLKNPDQDCRFLVDGRCSVYEARPTQCRTWPFWHENLEPEVWDREIAPFCPGVGCGRRYSQEEIARILEDQE